MYLVFDTETTGLPQRWNAPIEDVDNWPRVVQLAWQLHAADGSLMEAKEFLVRPEGFNIPFGAQKVHGISTALAQAQGHPMSEVLDAFEQALAQTRYMIGHNLRFDLQVLAQAGEGQVLCLASIYFNMDLPIKVFRNPVF